MGGGGRAPTPPDASTIASQQFGQNVNANTAGAFQNNPSVYTPYGSSQFSQSGTHTVNGQEVPTFRQDVSLSPDQQQLYGQQQAISSAGNQLAIEQQNAAQGRLGAIDPGQLSTNVNIPGQQSYGGAGRLMTNFDSGGAVQSQAGRDVGGVTQDRVNTNPRLNRSFSGYGNVQRSLGPNDFEDSRRRVEGAINSRLDPQLQRGRAELESRLANQGVMPGSEAYREAIALDDRGQNDARLQTVLAGGQEQTRLGNLATQYGSFANDAQGQEFGQAQSRAGFENNASQQGFQNDIARAGFNNQAGLAAQNSQLAASQNDLARGQFANQAQGQQYQQNQGAADFTNNATQQNSNNDLQALQYNNGLNNTNFDQQIAAGQFGNQARTQQFQNQVAGQNQLINSIDSLRQGGQVQSPNFAGFQGQNFSPVNTADIQQQQYQNQLGVYNAQQKQQQAMMGGLFGLGGSLLAAPMTGGGSVAGGLMGRFLK